MPKTLARSLVSASKGVSEAACGLDSRYAGVDARKGVIEILTHVRRR
jgi:hypothetical protein